MQYILYNVSVIQWCEQQVMRKQIIFSVIHLKKCWIILAATLYATNVIQDGNFLSNCKERSHY